MLKSALVESKKTFFNKTLTKFLKCSPQKFWRYFTDRKDEIEQIADGDVVVTEKKDIANVFNQFFQSVFTKDRCDSDDDPLVCAIQYPMEDLRITREGVFKYLLTLDAKNRVAQMKYRRHFFNGTLNGCRIICSFYSKIFAGSFSTSGLARCHRHSDI